jgi:hypothetical protein
MIAHGVRHSVRLGHCETLPRLISTSSVLEQLVERPFGHRHAGTDRGDFPSVSLDKRDTRQLTSKRYVCRRNSDSTRHSNHDRPRTR